MERDDAIGVINDAYTHLFKNAWTPGRLSREHITAAELDIITDLFVKDLSCPGATAETLIQGVADFYKRLGYTVTITINGFKIVAPAID